jgi:hypothetical protein
MIADAHSRGGARGVFFSLRLGRALVATPGPEIGILDEGLRIWSETAGNPKMPDRQRLACNGDNGTIGADT